jgi:hypothetical protein
MTESMKDDDLFKVNINKDGLKDKREKLKKDRFKLKEKPKSRYEEDKIKKIVESKQRRQGTP